MKKPRELSIAEKDLKEKVSVLLNDIRTHGKEMLRDYLKENTYAQEKHLESGMLWNVPKDFVVALLEDAIWNYSPNLGTRPAIRSHKKNVRMIKAKLYRR